MTGALAIARLELRMLRAEVLLGIGLLLAIVLWRSTSDATPAVSAYSRSAVLVALVLVALVRERSIARAWNALIASLPLTLGRVTLTRSLLWNALAGPFAAAFVLLLSPQREPVALLQHGLALWLWLAYVGVAAAVYDWVSHRGMSYAMRWFVVMEATLIVGAGLVLGFPAATGAKPASALFLAVGLVGLVVVNGAVALRRREWLPSQSPKPVTTRRAREKSRTVKRRTTKQVLRSLAGGAPLQVLLWVYAAFMAVVIPHRHAIDDKLGPLVLFTALTGALITMELKNAHARWAFLRGYPLRARVVWRGPILRLVFIPLIALGIGGWFATQSPPLLATPLTDETEFVEPELVAPVWVKGATDIDQRPPKMPLPFLAGMPWPLRNKRVQVYDERLYFGNAVAFYLKLVHGLDVPKEELRAALGKPFVLTQKTGWMPTQLYGEFTMESNVAGLSEGLRGRRSVNVFYYGPGVPIGKGNDVPADPGREIARYLNVRLPREIYGFAKGVEALEVSLEGRLRRSLAWRFVLDAALLLVGALLFARLALIRSLLRWALPVLAVIPAVLWANNGGAAWRLAIRDAHLAQPYVAVGAAIVLSLLLIVSIRRAVGNLDAADAFRNPS